MNGQLSFQGDIGSLHEIIVHALTTSSAIIDFNGHNIQGKLELRAGGGGNLLEGGRVTGFAKLLLGVGAAGFSGKCDLATVEHLPNDPYIGLVAVGRLYGGIRFTEPVSGQITIESIAKTGALTCESDFSGTLQVENDCDGLLTINGGVAREARLTVGALGSSARVYVKNLFEGLLDIDRGAAPLSLLHLDRGIAEHSRVNLNASNEGDNDANGTIRVGPAIFDPSQSVVFDGSLRIRRSAEGGGDLNGEIRVAGCHETDARLDICVCGAINGSVVIEQRDCPNQVGWSCNSGCP